ncbi:MAG: deoxyribonuclease V [Candidatus Edwardsbacteria bacterium]
MERKKYLKRYRELHREEIREYQKAYRRGNPKTKWQMTKWRKEHPEYFKKWKEKHPLYFHEWLQSHPEYFTEYMRKYRHPHDFSMVEEAIQIQKELSKWTILKDGFSKINYIAGADASIDKEERIISAGVCLFTYPNLELVEEVSAKKPLSFPYIPGLLSFREGPVLFDAISKLKTIPDVILFDGQGIAHPRGIGIATHLGILLNKPTIGCAKSNLCGTFKQPKQKRDSSSPLYLNGKIVGAVLRTKNYTQPIFVSPGHLISLKTAIYVVLACGKGYRIPEPLRHAHTLSKHVLTS